jgi:hypothetical protein
MILIIGAILRFISLIFVDLAPDSYNYLDGAIGILTGNYTTHRPPTFPLVILVFLVVLQNSFLAVKFASFFCGISLIIISNFVFSRTAQKILKDDKDVQEKSKLIGYLVSFFISVHGFLVWNNGMGIREELIASLSILLFYYVIVKSNEFGWKDYLILIILVSSLTLSHVSVGIFVTIGIVFFYLISKFKFIKINVFSMKVLFIAISLIGSYSFWLIFCWINFGDPFYTIRTQQSWFERNTPLDLGSLTGIIMGVLRGVSIGILVEFFGLFGVIGAVFTISIVIFLVKNFKNNQIFMLLSIIGVNFLYLSIFLAVYPDVRLMFYFLPFLFFLGHIFLVNYYVKKKDLIIGSIHILKKEFTFSIRVIFILYIFSFTLFNLFEFFTLLLFNSDSLLNLSNLNVLRIVFPTLGIVFYIIQEVFLFSFLIVPFSIQSEKQDS